MFTLEVHISSYMVELCQRLPLAQQQEPCETFPPGPTSLVEYHASRPRSFSGYRCGVSDVAEAPQVAAESKHLAPPFVPCLNFSFSLHAVPTCIPVMGSVLHRLGARKTDGCPLTARLLRSSHPLKLMSCAPTLRPWPPPWPGGARRGPAVRQRSSCAWQVLTSSNEGRGSWRNAWLGGFWFCHLWSSRTSLKRGQSSWPIWAHLSAADASRAREEMSRVGKESVAEAESGG